MKVFQKREIMRAGTLGRCASQMAGGVRGAYVRSSLHNGLDPIPTWSGVNPKQRGAALTWAGSLLKSPPPLKERFSPAAKGFIAARGSHDRTIT